MASSFSIAFGNFLYKNCFPLYSIVYPAFKKRQDKLEIELLQKYVKHGEVVLDIGANIGFYSKILSRLVGAQGKVHCFEPDITNFGHLRKAVEGLPNITINNKAVGPRTETIKIYTSKNMNVDHRTYKPDEFDKEIEVGAVSIDDYLKEDLRVDFVKMDIQGFESQAIKGMTRTFQSNVDLKLISEFWPYGLRKAGSSASEYFDFLTGTGCSVYILKEGGLQKLYREEVNKLEVLGGEYYFNIFATKGNG